MPAPADPPAPEALRPGFSTRAVHGAAPPPVRQVPASVPLHQTSTFFFESFEEFGAVLAGEAPGHVYGRGYGNPTVEAFEAVMADLEGTEAAMAFDSGMAAIHAVMTTLAGAGDAVVVSTRLYGGTWSLFHEILPRYGIEVRSADLGDPGAVRAALDGAVALYAETIDNPTLMVPDLAALTAACRAAGAASVIDSTFASPYLCTPAAHGFDYVVHSATKYLGGHSDLIGGVVCTTAGRRAGVRATALDVGGAMQPLEAWLGIRGVATLALRMERSCATAGRLAECVAASPAVATTYYPGLVSHPSHDAAVRQLRGFGGVLAFELAGGLDAARRFGKALQLVSIAASLGGTHTVAAHPASTTHRQLSAEARAAQGITDGLVRISVGLEDAEDLVADVAAALQAAR